MEISWLLAEISEDASFVASVQDLISRKRSRPESFEIARSVIIDAYLRYALAEIERRKPKNPRKQADEIYDFTFRAILYGNDIVGKGGKRDVKLCVP
jgi:hypothetical protein